MDIYLIKTTKDLILCVVPICREIYEFSIQNPAKIGVIR